MRVQRVVGLVATTLLLAACSGGAAPTGEPTATPPATSTPTVTAPHDAPATGTVDCSVFETEGLQTFLIWSQLFMQVRSADGLTTMSLLGYTPDAMASMLDDLDQLKGIVGARGGTPDEALAGMRKANGIFAAAIAKGDSVTDADFAELDSIYADTDAWLTAQSSITDSLHVACPDLTAT